MTDLSPHEVQWNLNYKIVEVVTLFQTNDRQYVKMKAKNPKTLNKNHSYFVLSIFLTIGSDSA